MKMKLPLALEAAESLIFVRWLVSVTLAPATMAPVGSRIVPLTSAVALCCARPTEPASRMNNVYITTGRKGRMTFLLRVWSDVSLGGSWAVKSRRGHIAGLFYEFNMKNLCFNM